MELTQQQISEFISKQTSNYSSFSELMSLILNSLMRHERQIWQSEHAESSNGFRPRRWRSGGYEFSLRVPRTRNGGFVPMLLGVIRNEDEERARLFTSLYSNGLTTEQIGTISEQIYGRVYSKQQISTLTGYCREDVEEWLARPLSDYYPVVYIDATYVYTRRSGSVSAEAYYTMLGVLPDGSREVLGLVNHPTEGAIGWELELKTLRERGVEKIDLIVSDALTGIEKAVTTAFPMAAHQLCVTHLKRNMAAVVSHKDKPKLLEGLKDIFHLEQKGVSVECQFNKFRTFVAGWAKQYPSLRKYINERNVAYFTYLDFPVSTQRMIYTTNWIERLNRFYKRTIDIRGAMPSAASAIFLMGTVAMEKTKTTYARKLTAFMDWNIKHEEHYDKII
ncbi:MAG: IS256 family transposase [Paludibacteraceae bacterium]